ncbi:hypothetical protein [Bacillus horti]|uniref:Phr family secreted Rap phosphatase inhibitor n=1 Tax=Caldalkalibacillus horti TaxID=77523 RepID=A0ABT9W4H4_9BACI|nr:hypothetical protein [Bacillus horti]MDQ0167760.1 hypothetical protein [Bacillus horti]
MSRLIQLLLVFSLIVMISQPNSGLFTKNSGGGGVTEPTAIKGDLTI